jgi:hypothetical protein
VDETQGDWLSKKLNEQLTSGSRGLDSPNVGNSLRPGEMADKHWEGTKPPINVARLEHQGRIKGENLGARVSQVAIEPEEMLEAVEAMDRLCAMWLKKDDEVEVEFRGAGGEVKKSKFKVVVPSKVDIGMPLSEKGAIFEVESDESGRFVRGDKYRLLGSQLGSGLMSGQITSDCPLEVELDGELVVTDNVLRWGVKRKAEQGGYQKLGVKELKEGMEQAVDLGPLKAVQEILARIDAAIPEGREDHAFKLKTPNMYVSKSPVTGVELCVYDDETKTGYACERICGGGQGEEIYRVKVARGLPKERFDYLGPTFWIDKADCVVNYNLANTKRVNGTASLRLPDKEISNIGLDPKIESVRVELGGEGDLEVRRGLWEGPEDRWVKAMHKLKLSKTKDDVEVEVRQSWWSKKKMRFPVKPDIEKIGELADRELARLKKKV